MNAKYDHTLSLLRQMLGNEVDFRDGQWEAIETIAVHKKRALVVQRTGWGKSIIYFLATKLLREQGCGPTLLISPLLSLMRNQIMMAKQIGISAETINSENREEWLQIEDKIHANKCDILLISPERLGNNHFRTDILPKLSKNVGLLVIDEAHCISDWGHDFRPDYRRIIRIMNSLPKGVPVLGTTATANDRVIQDIQEQFGEHLLVLRGPLVRTSLRLQNIRLADQTGRLAWLAQNINKFPGSGIVYCLTVKDTEKVANWLQLNGIQSEAYFGGAENREELEQKLLDNQIKALVSTVALGMGFDKPDVGFVIHFQRPGSVVAYYQQVGRAGRAMERAYGILLCGDEDDEIQEYFINSAFPPAQVMEEILYVLERNGGLGINELLSRVNISYSMAAKALKILEVDRVVIKKDGLYFRTTELWQPDLARIKNVTDQRYRELRQMQRYITHKGCLMEFLERALDDPEPKPCGKCANCQGKGFKAEVGASLKASAITFLSEQVIIFEPRMRLSAGVLPHRKRTIPSEFRTMPGRSLCYYGDAGWGKMVQKGKYHDNHFDDDLVKASAELICNRWDFGDQKPQWITAIPSRRRPHLVFEFANRLANILELPFCPILERYVDALEQKGMENSSMQARNVVSSLRIIGEPRPSAVLLVDDIRDSGWTLTIAGLLLREKNSGPVFPFTIARASKRKL